MAQSYGRGADSHSENSYLGFGRLAKRNECYWAQIGV